MNLCGVSEHLLYIICFKRREPQIIFCLLKNDDQNILVLFKFNAYLPHFVFNNLAPEIITGEGHDRMADWWSLGILAYETMFGIPPFYNQNQMIMYDLIRECNLKFPQVPEISDEGKDFIKCVSG